MRIFSGNSNIPLSKEICDVLDTPLGAAEVKTFSDGEIQVDIQESVRGMDVFVVQSTCTPGNTNLPVDHLFAAPVILEYMRPRFAQNLVVVSPDAGGVERARAFAKRMKASLAIIDKRRDAPNEAKFMNLIGEVKGLNAVILDDIVDTAGTLVEAASALSSKGAAGVYACCVHPVLSGPAIDRLNKSVIQEVIITNTIPLRPQAAGNPKFKVLSVARLLAEAIQRIHSNDSVSSLFV
jgi:ribose-phosphate pyrophosphokinase